MKIDPVPRTRVRFGTFEADLRSGELRRDGLKVKIQELPFQVLMVLLESPGKVVTREELRKRLWAADTFVDFEQGLNKAINKLRDALGDDANNPRFVETLPRRGYRFIGPVEALQSGTGPGRRSHSSVRTIVFTAAVIVALLGALFALNVAGLRNRLLGHATVPPKIHSIAVLPLDNLSGDPNQEYFAEGMTDELITELSKISGLRVIARTSAMRYKGTKKSLPEIARELNVDAVMESSVLRSGNRVRINARLVDGTTERVLWSETYDRNLEDILTLSSNLARDIAREVRIKLTPEEQQRLASTRSVKPEAYEAYLRGRYLLSKRTGEDTRKGLGYFEQAVEVDPKYAPAYAGAADAYIQLAFYGPIPPAAANAKAREAAVKAVTMDDSLAEGHASLADVLFHYDWDWSRAEKEFQRAIALNPGYAKAHHGYGWFLIAMRRYDEAIVEMKTAQDLDPLAPIINSGVGSALFYRGDYDLAIKKWQSTLDLNPNFWVLRGWLGLGYLAEGLNDKGLRELEAAVELSKGNPSALAHLGYGYAASGKRAKAQQILHRLRQKAKKGYVSPYQFAMVYAALGEKDHAIKYLEEAYGDHYTLLVGLNLPRTFPSLRSDPRFQDLLRRMNFPPRSGNTKP
jgi:TolB-like protein/DNA-binding winged helix-turn-helix (wHTH) protein/Tfp pilus assembly protein PilF